MHKALKKLELKLKFDSPWLNTLFFPVTAVQWSTYIVFIFIFTIFLANLGEGVDATPRYVAGVASLVMLALNIILWKYPRMNSAHYVVASLFIATYLSAGATAAGAGTTYFVFLPLVPVMLSFYYGIKFATFAGFGCIAIGYLMPLPHFYPYGDIVEGPGPDFGSIMRMRCGICTVAVIGCLWVADWLQERANWARERALQVKARFVACVSHELRTPLQSVGGCADVLKQRLDRAGDISNHEIVLEMSDSIEMLLTLVNNILDYTRADEGEKNMLLDASKFHLGELCKSCVRMMSRAAENAGITMDDVIFDNMLENAYFYGDSHRIQQVLVNFLGNAVKFTSRAPIRRISLHVYHVGDDDVRFDVTDTGTGVPQSKQHLLFRPFSHLDSTGGGTGLGLAVSREIATALRGECGMMSDGEGKGSTFWLQLPLPLSTPPVSVPPSPVLPPQVPTSKAVGTIRPRILLVDDNRHVKFAVDVMVGHLGFEMVYAENGAEALEILDNEGPFSMLLVDLQMPVMNGIEMVKIVRAREEAEMQRRLILALTASTDVNVQRECIEAGFDDFLSKPVTLERLVAAFAENGL